MPLARCRAQDPPPPGPARGRPDSRRAVPYRLQAASDFLEVYAREGQLLWMQRFDGSVRQSLLVDLDGDGAEEVVVAVGGHGAQSGSVFALDAAGEVLWQRDTNAASPYSGGGSGKLSVRRVLAADALERPGREVLALSIDAQGWYPARLTLLGHRGEIVSSYWHPGHLHHVMVSAADEQARPSIILAGLNNDLRPRLPGDGSVPVVFALDPEDAGGQAPPFLGRGAHGRHLWYGIILPKSQNVERLFPVTRRGDGRREIAVWTSAGHILYLGFDGTLQGRARSDGATGTIDFRRLR